MIWLMKLVGSKVIYGAVIALVVGLTLYTTTQYIQSVERDRVVQEMRVEELQKEVDTRRRVDEILQENRNTNPSRDGSIALERLRNRYTTTEGLQ